MNFLEERGIYTKTWGRERILGGCCLKGGGVQLPLRVLATSPNLILINSFSSFPTLYLSYFMSNLVFLESFGCLVSIDFDLMQFGATVVVILHSKGR